MIRLSLDTSIRQPIYQQLFEQLRLQMARGELKEGHRLPSVRELALDLRINPNTVARAYRELENAGLVVRQQGRGVFVRQQQDELTPAERWKRLQKPLDALLMAGWKLDLDPQELAEALKRRAAELFDGHSPKEIKK